MRWPLGHFVSEASFDKRQLALTDEEGSKLPKVSKSMNHIAENTEPQRPSDRDSAAADIKNDGSEEASQVTSTDAPVSAEGLALPTSWTVPSSGAPQETGCLDGGDGAPAAAALSSPSTSEHMPDLEPVGPREAQGDELHGVSG